jgi:hypothetical protein
MQFFFDLTAFIVALAISFAGAMWASVWLIRYPVPIWDLAKIFAGAFVVQLLIYSGFSFIIVDIQLRSYMVRASIIVLCLSQAVPLLYVYRSWKHGH